MGLGERIYYILFVYYANIKVFRLIYFSLFFYLFIRSLSVYMRLVLCIS